MADAGEPWPEGTVPSKGLPGPDDLVSFSKEGRMIYRGVCAKTHPEGSENPDRGKAEQSKQGGA